MRELIQVIAWPSDMMLTVAACFFPLGFFVRDVDGVSDLPLAKPRNGGPDEDIQMNQITPSDASVGCGAWVTGCRRLVCRLDRAVRNPASCLPFRQDPVICGLRGRATSACLILLCLLMLGYAAAPVKAADGQAKTQNWLMMDAVEPEGAPKFSATVSASLEYQTTQDTPLLAGPWSGQPDQFNRFAPRYGDGAVLRIPQAGVAVHGRLMDGALSYRATLLAGDNQLLRNERGYYDDLYIRPIDASVTVNAFPQGRLRLGLFRQPLGDEAASPRQRFIWRTHVTQQMVQERYFRSDGSVNGDPNLDLGPVSGFRDIGVQLFDAFQTGAWEHTYALMLGLGTGIDPTLPQTGIDTYLYWSSERIFGRTGRNRDGLKLYAWGQFGTRSLQVGPLQTTQEFDRRRAGIGASLRNGRWSLSSEWIVARGMIYHGPDGGTIPGRLSNDGTLVAGYNVLPDSESDGGYVDLGYRPIEPLELMIRYDVLNRGTDDPNTTVRFQGLSLGGIYRITPALQVMAGYQLRDYSAPRLSADSTTNRLLDGVDNRFGIRLLYQVAF